MKRPFYVALLGLAIISLLVGYAKFLASMPRAANHANASIPVNDSFTLILTGTTSLEADAFALNSADSLTITLAGEPLVVRNEKVVLESPLRIEKVTGFVQGKNMLFIRATPSASGSQQPQALRLQVFQGDNLLADATFWASAGEAFAGEVQVQVPAKSVEEKEHS